MKYYSVGEITRLGLLKNHKGEPYKHKATVSRIVSRMRREKVSTAWGGGWKVAQSEIDKHNRKHIV